MRYVQILSPFLTQPLGTIVSQDRLNMSDDKLDEFIAAGYGIECEIEYEAAPVDKRTAIERALGTENFAPKRRRKGK